jgi:protein SCO1/2
MPSSFPLSIFFYLMDSDGQFMDAFGKNSTPADITAKVMEHVDKWKAAGREI